MPFTLFPDEPDSRSLESSISVGGDVDISRSLHCLSIHKPGGQRKSSKHIINFWQNIDRVAQELSLQPGTDDVPLLVRRSSNDGTKHYDFRVRRDKVRTALQWLKANHKWYRHI